MIKPDEIIKIGKTQKTHALKGELNLISDIDAEYFQDGNPLIVEDDGILVPYYVETIRPKGNTSYLVKILGIDNDTEASQFVNKEISILKKDAEKWLDDEIIDTNDLEGYKIVEASNGEILGVVDHIDDTTPNLLFIVKKDSGEEIFIPANEDFIVEIDDENKVIRMELPEGLIELNN